MTKHIFKSILCLALMALSLNAKAQSYVFGTTPALHVDGNKLKDPNGGTVTLHGVMDTPSPYFNSYRWGTYWSGPTDEAVTRAKDYFDKITTAITQPSRGTYCNLFRLHLEPWWSNTGSTTGEDDISKFSADRLRTYLNSLFIPIALNAISKGLYVIIRPPGVFPNTVNVGDNYNNYLMTVWDIVSSNSTIKQYSGQISLELGNEPVNVKINGQDNAAALHNYFQPIVNKIRQNGFNGILWIPGSGWQSQYATYVNNPISDPQNNYGYAVHDYVGWYNGDNSAYADWRLNNYINQFHTQVPVIDNYPIVITEVDWSPENGSSGHYDEHGNWVVGNFGTWATGTTSNWGRLYKGLLDRYPENISMTLSGTDTYIDVEAYLNNGTIRPAYTTAMQQNGFANAWEACSGACFEWYKIWGQAQMNGSGGGIATFSPDQQTGRYYASFNDLSVSGDLSFDRNTGVLSLPAGKSGKLTLTFSGADFSNVSTIKMSHTGDDLFNTLMIKNSAGNSVNTDGGAFYSSRYQLNYTNYQGNSSAVNTLEWEGHNDGSATKTMTLQQILIQEDVMWASKKHEIALAQAEFGTWNSIDANAAKTGDDADMEYNLNQFIAGYGTVYGNGSVLSHNYADLTKYTKLRVYGDNGLLVRALFNRTSDEQATGNGSLQPYIEYNNPANLAGKTFAIVRDSKALYGTDMQNLAFDSYTSAFSSANSGYLFKAESITVNGQDYFLLRLMTPAGEEYSVYGGTAYLNSQPTDGWCSFVLGLNNQNGQDIENGAVWDIKYVDGQGMTIRNVGTGLYLANAGPANSESPVYWTLCTLKEQTNTNLIEKAGEIADGVFEVDLKTLGDFAHLNALKVGGGSGSVWRVMVVDDESPMDYYVYGKKYVEDNLAVALNDRNATNYDATGLTNRTAVALNTVNKNALIYVDNASRLSNSANVVVKNGNNYSASNIVLTDGVSAAQGQRAYAALTGGTPENATWTENNGNYTFEWASGASGQYVEIMHWVYLTEQNNGCQYKYMLIDTEEYTSKWGVQFLDGDGRELAKQEYWVSMADGGATTKILNIDALFAVAGNSSKRANLTKIRLYNFDSNSGGKVVVKEAYLYNEPTENVYPFYAPYDITAANAKLTTKIGDDGFTLLTTPFAASLPSGFTSYALLEDQVLEFDRINANAPMLVKGNGELVLTASGTTIPATDGLNAGVLQGTYKPTAVAAGNYVQKEATRDDSFSPVEGTTLYIVSEGQEPTIYPFHAYATAEVQTGNNDDPDPDDPDPTYEPFELTVSSAGVATVYLPFDAVIPDADFFAAAGVTSISGSTAYLKEVKGGIIPANTGVMIFANPGKYLLYPSSTPATTTVQSIMHGVLVDTPINQVKANEGGANIYVLSRGIEEYTGFKIVGSTVKSITANKAYIALPADSNVKEIRISFGGETPTGIDDVKAILNGCGADMIYDLSGRRVNNPTKGIYIINGKKVLIK
ncbi:MAG: cellulase family glycosylhydrolase [Bacteroidaceae bacterium]|nr:cellulase family glycosylhydrolase [Bacteroidaceae bacterium]